MTGRRKKERKERKKRNQTVNTVLQRIVSVTETCFGRRKRNPRISESASSSEDVVEKTCRQEGEIKDHLEQKMGKYRIKVSEKISTPDAVYSDPTKRLVRASNNTPILVHQPHIENMKLIFSEYSHMTWLIPYMAERDDDASTKLVMNDPVTAELIINDTTIEGKEEQECETLVQSIINAVIIGIEQEETDSKRKADDAFEVCTNLVEALVTDAVAESQEQKIVHSMLDEALNKIDEDEAGKKRIEDEDAVELCKNLPITPTCSPKLPSFFNSNHFEVFELEHVESTPTCCPQLPSYFNLQRLEDFELEPAESTSICCPQRPSVSNSQRFEDFELEPAKSTTPLRLPSFFDAEPNLPSFFSATASDNLSSSVCNLSFPSGSAGSPEFSAIQPVISQSINAVQTLATDLPSLSWDDVEYVSSRQGDATILGSGTYATVYLARQRSCGRLVAVKEFKEGLPRQEILNEAGIIHALAGTGFVPELVGVIIPAFDNWSPCIVQDYFGGGKTPEALLYGEGEASFPKELWFSILHQLSLAIKSFCYHKIIHNDLKPDNILVDVSDLEDVKVKVIDFGLATKGRGYIFRGTQEKFARCPHMAPEAKQGRFTTVASDVYSLGYIFNEMAKLAPSIFPIAFRCMAENSDDRPNPDEVTTLALQLLS